MELSDYQKNVVEEMVAMDFCTGHPADPADESLRQVFEEDPDFEGVIDEAIEYYTDLIDLGPEGFAEDFPELCDEDFLREFGSSGDEDDYDDYDGDYDEGLNEDEDEDFDE